MQKREKDAGSAHKGVIEAFYAEHRSSLVAYAARLLRGDRAAAEDAVQDAFVAIWCDAAAAADRSNLYAWMQAIVRNKAIDGWRKSHRLVPQGDQIAAQLKAVPDERPQPDKLVAARQLSFHLRASITRLPIRQRRAIEMHYFEFAPVAKIAANERCSDNTVKTRLHYGRIALGKNAALH